VLSDILARILGHRLLLFDELGVCYLLPSGIIRRRGVDFRQHNANQRRVCQTMTHVSSSMFTFLEVNYTLSWTSSPEDGLFLLILRCFLCYADLMYNH
jgi:hypothetical protein